MSGLPLLIFCFLAGMLLRRTGRFPENTHVAFNGFIIHVSLPALAILYIHELSFDPSLLLTAAMAWFLFLFGLAFFLLAGRRLGFSRETTGALILLGGLGNTSFVGLPMIEAYYGPSQVSTGIIADQLGTFLVLSTLGIAVAAYASSAKPSGLEMARRVLLFPPFQALLLSFLLIPLPFPGWLTPLLKRLGDTLTPLALVSVGFQVRFSSLKQELAPLGLGLLFKLALGPALLALLYVGVFGARGEVIQVTIFEAAMAPMITGGIVAADHGLNPRLVSLLLGIGIPLSFATVPVWWWLLRGI